jgi:hypothetical protein
MPVMIPPTIPIRTSVISADLPPGSLPAKLRGDVLAASRC